MTARALRGAMIGFRADPFLVDPGEALVWRDDVLVVIEDGRIVSVEDAATARMPAGVAVEHHADAVLSAGFIDTHVHYPQLEVIGAFGTQLLEWLERYTFPAETRFADKAHADRVAALFLREILRHGTTTACVYCTVHPQSVDAFFEESERFNTRMIAGKVLMDRNAPPALTDTPETGYADSKALIARWHGRGRQLYAITPRFAATSTAEQLEAAGRLWSEHPGTYVQTHIAEDAGEIAWVKQLFPERDGYLDVYDKAGLTGPRTVFAHAIHMSEDDFCLCHARGAALSHCPTSNLFLGSGLFRAFDAKRADRPVRTSLGTDVGGGTSLSQLQTLNEAYKVAALNAAAGKGQRLTAAHGFWLATKGGAEALYLDDRIGAIEPGLEADIAVLDLRASPLAAFRLDAAKTSADRLFALMTLADPRSIRATYVAGEKVYDRDAAQPFRYPA